MKKNEFLEFATSLKLVRKAAAERNGKNIINDIYTDLLPDDGILKQVNLPRTSIIKGRKGTGKSTVFQKSIEDMKKDEKVITVYIDVKSLFDGATPALSKALPLEITDEIKRYLIYKNFLFEVINEASKSLKQSIKAQPFLKRIFKTVNGTEIRVEEEFKKIKDNVDDVVKDIDAQFLTIIKQTSEKKNSDNALIDAEVSKKPFLKGKIENTSEDAQKAEFSNVILQYFDIKKCLIESFLSIREILGVKYIYMYLDDYSEMDEEAQHIFMDWFVAPLNNVSDDFVKFKIATYPNRFYFGKIDNQKVDEINLDFYKALYAYKNITKMERLSIDYIKRLIENRMEVFLPKESINDYFDMSEEELYETMFDISLNTPRIIGYVLAYCYSTHISSDKKITKAALNVAAQKYFEDVTQQYFESNKFVISSFDEMASRENLRFLMDKIVNKAKENDRIVNLEDKRNLPTSHFLIAENLTKLLDSLELNGYITTYNKVNDKDNNPSTLYAISYGLCQKYGIKFGRPKSSDLRQYYLERKFLFNDLLVEHFNMSQEVVCTEGHTFSFDKLEEIKAFGMICPTCAKNGKFLKCQLKVTNKQILSLINDYINNSLSLDDELQFEIINYLGMNCDSEFRAQDIASELDCTYQLIAKRTSKLIGRELVESNRKNGHSYYKISEYGKKEIIRRKDKV